MDVPPGLLAREEKEPNPSSRKIVGLKGYSSGT
jgi:hypothetical protein